MPEIRLDPSASPNRSVFRDMGSRMRSQPHQLAAVLAKQGVRA